MEPTMQAGDVVVVSKYSYGYSRHSFPLSLPFFPGRIFYSEPKRGDLVVFKLPSNIRIDWVKRIIGLPGDKIQMKNGRLFINGEMVSREKMEDFVRTNKKGNLQRVTRYIESLPNGRTNTILEEFSDKGPLDSTKTYEVPPDHYFVMGDNRDNSLDSRVSPQVGFIPQENLVGEIKFIIGRHGIIK